MARKKRLDTTDAELVSVRIKCPVTKKTFVCFSISTTHWYQECDLCGSHEDVTITTTPCPHCGNYHSVQLLSG